MKKSLPDDGIGGDQLLDPSSSSSSHHHGRGVTTVSSHSHSSSSSSSTSTTTTTLVLTPPPSSSSSSSSRRRGSKKNWNKQPPKKQRRLKQRQQECDYEDEQQQHENRLSVGVSLSQSKLLLPLQTNNLTAAAASTTADFGVGVGVGVPVSSSSSSSFNIDSRNNNNNNNSPSLQNMVRQAMMNLEAAAAEATPPQVLEEEEDNDNDFSSLSSCFVLENVVSPSSRRRHRRLGQRQQIWWKIETKEQQQLFNQQMVHLRDWIEQIQSDNDTFLASHPYLQKKKEEETKKTTSSNGQQQQRQRQLSSSSSFSWPSSPSFCTMLLEGGGTTFMAQEMSTEEAESFSLSPIPLHRQHYHQQQQQQQKEKSMSQPDVDVLDRQSRSDNNNNNNNNNSRNILADLSGNSPSRSSLLGDDNNEGIVINNMSGSSSSNNNGNIGGRDQEMNDMDTTATTNTRLLWSFQVQDAIGTSTGVFEENRHGSNSNSKSSSTSFNGVSDPSSTLTNNGLAVPFRSSTNPFRMSSDSTADDKYNNNSKLHQHHHHHRQRRSTSKYRDGNHPPLYPTVLEFDQAAEYDTNNDFEASSRGVVRNEYNGHCRLRQNKCNDGETTTIKDAVSSKNTNTATVDRFAYGHYLSDGTMMQPVRMNGSSSVHESMTTSTKNDEVRTPYCQQTISRTLFPYTEKKGPAPKTSKKKMNAAGEEKLKWPVVESTLVSSSSSHGVRTTGPDQTESSTDNFDKSIVVELPPRSQKNSRPLSSSQGTFESQWAPRLLRKKSSIQSTASNGTTSSCASNESVCVTPTPKELKFVEANSNPFGELDTYMDTQLEKDHMRFLSQRSGVSQNSTNKEDDDDGDFLRRQKLIGRRGDMTKDVRLPLPRTKAIAPRTTSRLDESSDMMMIDQEPVHSPQSRIQQDDRFNLLRDSEQTMKPSSSLTASPGNPEDTLKPTNENMLHQGPDFYRDVQLEQLKTIAASTDRFHSESQEIDQLAVKQALGVINIPPFPEHNFAFPTKQKATTKEVQATRRKCYGAKKSNNDGDRNDARSNRSSALTPIQEASDKDDMTTDDLTPKMEKSLLKTPPSYGTESSNENVSVEHRLQPKQRRSPNSKSQEIAYRAAMAAGFLSSGNNSSFLSSRQSFSEHQEELNYKASVMDLGEMGNEEGGSSTLRRNRSEGYFQVDPLPNEFLDRNNNKAPRRVSDFTER